MSQKVVGHTLSIFMSFPINSSMWSSEMNWKPEPQVVFHAILATDWFFWV